MNNVIPPSKFTAHILLHSYTQERSKSSAKTACLQGIGSVPDRPDARARIGVGSSDPAPTQRTFLMFFSSPGEPPSGRRRRTGLRESRYLPGRPRPRPRLGVRGA